MIQPHQLLDAAKRHTARADGARMTGAHEMAERHTRAALALIQAAHAVRDTIAE